MRPVVDASVAVKWVVAENHSAAAASLLECESMNAPAHWLAEALNAVWAKAARGELSPDGATKCAAALRQAPVRPCPLIDLIEPALELSLALGVTIYDSLYIALARNLGEPFVTADERLVRRTAGAALPASLVRWIGDFDGKKPGG